MIMSLRRMVVVPIASLLLLSCTDDSNFPTLVEQAGVGTDRPGFRPLGGSLGTSNQNVPSSTQSVSVPNKVVIFGDSLSAGYFNAGLKDYYRSAGEEIYGMYETGISAGELLLRIKEHTKIDGLEPADYPKVGKVIIALGTNPESSVAKYTSVINDFVKQIHELFSDAKIYFIAPYSPRKDMSTTYAAYRDVIDNIAQQIGATVLTPDVLKILSSNPYCQADRGGSFKDGIHPDTDCYRGIAQGLPTISI